MLDLEDPLIYTDVMTISDSKELLRVMKSKIKFISDNQVWNLVNPPEGAKPIENKWIFKRKTYVDDNLTIYKARLVANGFRQI